MMLLKFRVFINDQFYYYGWIWIEGAGLSWVSPPTQGEMSPLEVREKSEACTGLTDKAGKEIYAGDILRTDEAGWVGKVVYQHDHYMIIDDAGGFSGEPNWGKCEIIGTIHQHPELLEGTA